MNANKYKHLKKVAFSLLVIGEHSQKQVAEILDVCEPTIVNWKKTPEWIEDKEHYETSQQMLKNNADLIKTIQQRALSKKRGLTKDELSQIDKLYGYIIAAEANRLYGLKRLGIVLHPIPYNSK